MDKDSASFLIDDAVLKRFIEPKMPLIIKQTIISYTTRTRKRSQLNYDTTLDCKMFVDTRHVIKERKMCFSELMPYIVYNLH